MYKHTLPWGDSVKLIVLIWKKTILKIFSQNIDRYVSNEHHNGVKDLILKNNFSMAHPVTHEAANKYTGN